MPAYNFKTQFADAVESGKKCQTIRPRRKRLTRAGDELILYTAQRTKQCRILRRAKCVSVQPVVIYDRHVSVDGRVLAPEELHDLAQNDGFTCAAELFGFFTATYGQPRCDMELIRWEAP